MNEKISLIKASNKETAFTPDRALNQSFPSEGDPGTSKEGVVFSLLDGATSQIPIIAPELETRKAIAADRSADLNDRLEAFEDILDSEVGDTTRRLSLQGITHYDGLYDQSRYFDNALTRYFHRKGWGISQFSSRYLGFSSKWSVGWYAHISKISPDGVLGDPTKATPEKGRRIWALMIKHLVEFVEDIKSLSLDEIFQRRY
ncbi:MAG: creatininase family protein [Pseudomonadota bacterium]